ncbi:MAG TPA: hypothetical protein VFI30_07085 [Nocardioidaceae bacterium]|nr:hypothetical protein [Nocardioidaceae bacterium]
MSNEPVATTHRCSRVPGLRAAGTVLVAIGAMVIVAVLAGSPQWAGWVLVGLLALLVAVVLRMVVWPPVLLALSADGYRIGHVRGGSTRTASWEDVESATTTTAAGGPVVVITLTDGRRSVLPLNLLGGRALAAQHDIHDRLDEAFGYRPVS